VLFLLVEGNSLGNRLILKTHKKKEFKPNDVGDMEIMSELLGLSGCCGNGIESGCLLKMLPDKGKMDANAAVGMIQQLRQTHTALKNQDEINVFVMQL
jgi:hypothetical protein